MHLIGAGAFEPFPFRQPDATASYAVQAMFLTTATRPAMQQRHIDFLPFAGTIVSVPRTYSNYVVTEYGVVNLLGKSQRERAELLMSIAHPHFRDA